MNSSLALCRRTVLRPHCVYALFRHSAVLSPSASGSVSPHSHRCFHHSPVISQQQQQPDSQREGDGSDPPSKWQWVPPRANRRDRDKDLEEVVPFLPGMYLEVEEITKILKHYKGENIATIPLGKEKNLDGIDYFIIVSGDTSRHLWRMADAILRQVRMRKLLKAASFKNGVEGDRVDDWLVVDCHNCVVHCMLPAKRRDVDLESHWGAATRPYAQFTGSDKEYEESLDRLCNQFPPPEDRHTFHDDSQDKEKSNSNVIRFPSSNSGLE